MDTHSPDGIALPSPAATAIAARRGFAAQAAAPLLMLVAALVLRALSFVPTVIDTDEGLYILQAREWLRGGGWPLVAVWDMHPIGAPALVALGMAVFGEGVGGVRLLGAICVALTGWALYGGVRAAGAPVGLGLAAGMLYIAHTALFGGLATNTEILFAPFVAAAMAIGIRGATRALEARAVPGWRELLAMGTLVGTALMVKPVAAPEGCLAFALLTLPAWWRGLLPLPRAFAMAAAYAALCAAPTALFALVYAVQGQFWAFLDGSFLAPMRYAGGRLPFSAAAWEVGTALLMLAWPMALAGFAATALLRMGAVEAPARRLTAIGLLWFAAATLAIVGPGMFFNHYFLIWLPPLSILAALGAWRLARVLVGARQGATAVLMAAVIGILAADAWTADAAPRFQRGIGLRAPDPPRQVAEALAAVVPPGAPVLVANYHSVVVALAKAGLASRYAFPPHLTGHYGTVAGIDMDAEVARVLASRPAAIVVDRGWWHTMRPSAAAMVSAALERDYELAATVAEERGPVEIWRRR